MTLQLTVILGLLVSSLVDAQPASSNGLASAGGHDHMAAADAGAAKPGTSKRTLTREGFTVSVLPAAQRKALGVEFALRVDSVDPRADVSGRVNAGDVIVGLNDDKFSSLDEFERLLSRHKPGSMVALWVARGEFRRIYVPLKVLGK